MINAIYMLYYQALSSGKSALINATSSIIELETSISCDSDMFPISYIVIAASILLVCLATVILYLVGISLLLLKQFIHIFPLISLFRRLKSFDRDARKK
jgi:hypothetical protein